MYSVSLGALWGLHVAEDMSALFKWLDFEKQFKQIYHNIQWFKELLFDVINGRYFSFPPPFSASSCIELGKAAPISRNVRL